MSTETSAACGELQARADKLCEGDGDDDDVTSLVETALTFLTEEGFRTHSLEELDTLKTKIETFLMKILELKSPQAAECLMQSVHARFYRAMIKKVKVPKKKKKEKDEEKPKIINNIIVWWTNLWNAAETDIYISRKVSENKLKILKDNITNSLKVMRRDDRCEPSASGACVIS